MAIVLFGGSFMNLRALRGRSWKAAGKCVFKKMAFSSKRPKFCLVRLFRGQCLRSFSKTEIHLCKRHG